MWAKGPSYALLMAYLKLEQIAMYGTNSVPLSQAVDYPNTPLALNTTSFCYTNAKATIMEVAISLFRALSDTFYPSGQLSVSGPALVYVVPSGPT